MKKIYIPFVVFCVVLACLLCPLTASAAATDYQTSQLLIPQISIADTSIEGYSSAVFINGAVATPFWVGQNDTAAFTFGNFWISNSNRVTPDAPIDGYRLAYKIPFTASSNDTVRLKTTITLQHYYGATLTVQLVPAVYENGGYITNWYTIYNKSANSKNTIDASVYLKELDFGSSTKKVDAECFFLIVDVYGLQKTAFATNGIWQQFSQETSFSIVDPGDAAVIAEQEKTNKKLDDLIAKQQKTNDILTEEKYQGADTSTSDELTSAEDKLMQDTEQGREDVEEIMSVDSFMDNLNKLMPGILAATQIMDLCFDTIAPLQTLVYIGLALGFVSFVLGTINMVVGSVRSANARKEREAKNDAYREKVFNENKRYHDGMLNRRGRR